MNRIEDTELNWINEQLRRKFGESYDRPNFRLSYSEDQFEIRLVTHTKEGFPLLTPEMQNVPKYKQWIHEKYVLEKLTVVPEFQRNELAEVLSYEPVWVFEDDKGNALHPQWRAIHFIIENLLEAGKTYQARGAYVKYRDPESTPEEAREFKEQRLKAIEEALFGNENETTDAMAYKEGVVVPREGHFEKQMKVAEKEVSDEMLGRQK